MTPQEILERTRQLIQEHAGEDADKWWYANRFVFARLQLDERKTNTAIKRNLLDAGGPCHSCGKPFETRRDVHLHRLDGGKGYHHGNCVLMHAGCHRTWQAAEEIEADTSGRRGRSLSSTKYSKRYDDMPFLYWWDISPGLAEKLDEFETIEFVQKDTEQLCIVSSEQLKPYVTPDRQTTRGQGNWGIKVLKDRPDELAFEPGTGHSDWAFLPVVWIDESDD